MDSMFRQRFVENGEEKLVGLKEEVNGRYKEERREKMETIVKCESVCGDLSRGDVKRLVERAVPTNLRKHLQSGSRARLTRLPPGTR
jgi:hypothetical protein